MMTGNAGVGVVCGAVSGAGARGRRPGFSDTCPVERTETPAPNEGEARFEQRYDEHRVREFSSAGACRASICVR